MESTAADGLRRGPGTVPDRSDTGQPKPRGRRKRLIRAAVVSVGLILVLLAGLFAPPEIRRYRNGIDATVIGSLDSNYLTDSGGRGPFLSDRDCGWGTEVSGTTSAGSKVDRTIWGFCDSAAYATDGEAWPMPLGFPTNTMAVALPGIAADGGPGAIFSPAFADEQDRPTMLKPWIRTGVDDTAPAACPDGYTRHEWLRGMTTLPDVEPTTETIIIFYQNYCADGAITAYEAGSGGVAVAQWSAERPDELMAAERLNDLWLQPGLLPDKRRISSLAAFTYGTGPLVITEGDQTYLYIYMCGAAGDCHVARSAIDTAATGKENAVAMADTANWTYRSETDWELFPPATEAGTCAPTPKDRCGDLPAPLVVSDARRFDNYTQPGAEPSIKEVDGRYFLLYAPGIPSDVFVVRTADSPLGPFGDDRFIEMPDGSCSARCRVPIWHPELDTQDGWAFSFYDSGSLTNTLPELERQVGEVRVARMPPLPPS